MTYLLVVGLNQTTAPLSLREQVHCARADVPVVLNALAQEKVRERAVLSTCNRTELYAVVDDIQSGERLLRQVIADRAQRPLAGLDSDLMIAARQKDAVRHLFAVACGIESTVIGEFEILRQVRESYQQSLEHQAAGPILSRLFTGALHAGKRARAETGIATHAASVAYAAVRLAQQEMAEWARATPAHALEGRDVLIVGAGEMGSRIAKDIAAKGPRRITIANRDVTRAGALARQVGGQAISIGGIPSELAEADIVITATSAPETVIWANQVADAIARRAGRPLWLIDVAMPRDVEARVAEMKNVTLYNLDDLRRITEAGRLARESEIGTVRSIIEAEVAEFWGWLMARRAAPVLAQLYARGEAIRQAELEKTWRRLPNLDDESRQALDSLTRSILSKFLACPTEQLKAHVKAGHGDEYIEAISSLFSLEHSDE